jgi:hypothetical protein
VSLTKSETPRVDAVAPHLNLSHGDMRMAATNLRDFARQLERELNELRGLQAPEGDAGTQKMLTALVERAYGIFTASGVLRVAEQDPQSNDPIVAWASDVRSILYRSKPATIDTVLKSIERLSGGENK